MPAVGDNDWVGDGCNAFLPLWLWENSVVPECNIFFCRIFLQETLTLLYVTYNLILFFLEIMQKWYSQFMVSCKQCEVLNIRYFNIPYLDTYPIAFLTCEAVNIRWWEIDIHGCYSLLKTAFAPIYDCKNNRRIWRHNASTSHARDVTNQLWWHNA